MRGWWTWTSALYVALRALAAVKGAGEIIILPDLILSDRFDGVLLAGWTPCVADVVDRYTLDLLSVFSSTDSNGRARS
jgi:dTDP-4-amino-4,6-dideoxygalactose transaminase